MIPREFSQALGESTSLREFVGRRMSKEFNSRFTKIPQEVRELVRESMIQDLCLLKVQKVMLNALLQDRLIFIVILNIEVLLLI